jgi:hypothetical protein
MEHDWLSDSWDSLTLQYANGACNNTIQSILTRLVLAIAVYHLWKERNSRLFTGEEMGEQVLWEMIVEKIKIQLLSLKVKRFSSILKISQKWDVEMKIVDH